MTMMRRLKEPHEYVMAVTKAECVGPDVQVVVRQLPHRRSMIRPWIQHHLPRVSRKFRKMSTGSDTLHSSQDKYKHLLHGCNSLCVHHMLTFYPWPVWRCGNHRQPSVTGCIRVECCVSHLQELCDWYSKSSPSVQVRSIAVSHTFKIDKARRELGYCPRTYSLVDCVDQYLKNRQRGPSRLSSNLLLQHLILLLLLLMGLSLMILTVFSPV